MIASRQTSLVYDNTNPSQVYVELWAFSYRKADFPWFFANY